MVYCDYRFLPHMLPWRDPQTVILRNIVLVVLVVLAVLAVPVLLMLLVLLVLLELRRIL